MASVKSGFRNLIKPILFKALGESGYEYFQYRAKLRDIEGRLVEEYELALFPEFIKNDDEVLDIGANYAYHTHRMANLCPNGTVHAFEPIPFTYRVCKRIIEHYGFTNVKLYQRGVGKQNETIRFRVPVVDFGAMSAGQAHMADRENELEGKSQYYNFDKASEFDCEVVALDDFLTDLKQLTFVKMDIEGAEYFALQGMQGILRRFKPVIMIEISPFYLQGFGIGEKDLRDFAHELGYSFFRYNPQDKKLARWGDSEFEEANYLMLTAEHESEYGRLVQG